LKCYFDIIYEFKTEEGNIMRVKRRVKNPTVIEQKDRYKGFQFVVTLNTLGHRCGYVIIPHSSPLFVNIKPIKSFNNYKSRGGLQSYLSKRVVNFNYFRVHGGITFESVETYYPIKSKKRQLVLGFDAGHYGDSPDFEAFEKYYPETFQKMAALKDLMSREGEVRDKEYMVYNCKELIDQLCIAQKAIETRNKIIKSHSKRIKK